ncbi:MAG: antitoxin [Acidimicrobiaceae bacterium]|nr:antitoxin [Acidimicrobiaceae bacterium]MBO0747663.1 antitoxin [Acidimicrobiaceae bacterium]
MGVLDTLKGLVGGHKDQAKEGVDKAGQVADQRTGGSHSSQIDAAEKKADEEIDNLDGGGSNP